MQPGDEVFVPNISNNEEKAIEDTYSYYTVLKSEGYMALDRKLGLSKEELEALNPQLKEGGLKLGMVIKVPKDVGSNVISEDLDNTNLALHITHKSTKRIALMMPYRLNRIDVDSISEAKKAIRTDSRLSISLDFHSGVLLALDSAKHLGISTHLKVYDTRDQTAEITKILNANDFSQYDAVIGPLMSAQIERVASELKSDNVPVVLPFTTPKNLYSNVFQTIPSGELLAQSMINFVKTDTLIQHIIIISDQKNKTISNRLKSEFPTAKQIYSQKNKEGADAFYIPATALEDVFLEGENIVFLESDNEGFVSNVTSMLNGLTTPESEIILMTTDKNKAFEGKEISNFHLSNLKFHFPSVYKACSTPAQNNFIKNYKKEYGVEPNKYAVRGFDLTLDVLLRLASEDDLYAASKSDVETEYVENKFRYSKKLFGGYFNEALYIVKYDNLSIIEATH